MADDPRRSTAPPARRRPGGLVPAALLLAAVLAVITVLVAVAWPPLVGADQAADAAANAAVAPRPGLVAAIRAVTDAGSPVAVDVLTAVAVIGLAIVRRFRAAVYLALVRGVELGLETLIKIALDRPRPDPSAVLATASGAAFPSGHTAGTAALCVSLLLVVWRLLGRGARTAAILLAALYAAAVAASRVLLAVHFPSDVVGGLVLGALCAVALAAGLRPQLVPRR